MLPRPWEQAYSGIGDCVKKIYQNEGLPAFWKGSFFRVCRIAPQFGISLLAYEKLSGILGFKGQHATPPTNAPVDPRDYRTAFPTGAIGNKTDDIGKMVRSMGFKNNFRKPGNDE